MITFLGDVALLSNSERSNYIPTSPYIFNLEYVIGDTQQLHPEKNKLNLLSNNSNFEDCFAKNPIAVSVANNHIFDYGHEGLLSTIRRLDEKKIGVIEAKPFWLNGNICLISYTCFGGKYCEKDFFSFSKEKSKRDIQMALGTGAKRIIVLMHWGVENQPYASKEQIEIGHFLIEVGADLVIGNHPHCIQPIEIYNGKTICYSLGNCVFPNHHIDSHYDERGKSHRRWHTRWCKWNNQSLAAIYDEDSNRIDHIDCLFYKEGRLVKTGEASVNQFSKNKNNKVLFLLRKYVLFIHSNMFVEGKLIDVSAFKNEVIRKLRG